MREKDVREALRELFNETNKMASIGERADSILAKYSSIALTLDTFFELGKSGKQSQDAERLILAFFRQWLAYISPQDREYISERANPAHVRSEAKKCLAILDCASNGWSAPLLSLPAQTLCRTLHQACGDVLYPPKDVLYLQPAQSKVVNIK